MMKKMLLIVILVATVFTLSGCSLQWGANGLWIKTDFFSPYVSPPASPPWTVDPGPAPRYHK